MTVKDLTLGAIIAALYAILVIFGRLVAVTFDSLIYYIIPLPIAIYTYLKGYKTGLIALFTMIAVSFLIQVSWIDVLVLSIPNLLIGYLFGVFKRKINNGINIFIIFLLSLGACYLSFISLKITTGLSFFEYTFNDMESINHLFNLPDSIFTRVITILIPIVIILDSLMKSVFLYVVFIIVVKVLKIDENITIKINLNPNIYLTITSVLLTAFTMIMTGLVFQHDLIYLNLLLSLLYVLLFIIDLYVAYIFITYICRILMVKNKKGLMFTLYFVMIILLPLCYIGGVIYSIFYKNLPVY